MPARSASLMETEKYLCFFAMIAAGLVILVFLLDAATGLPFGGASKVLDILFILGAALVLWQGIESYREFR